MATTKKAEQQTEDIIVQKEERNIFQRMAAITAELGTVAKNLDVRAGGGSYKAVSERDILDAVKPLEEKHGVYSYPSDREILEATTLESESTYNGKTTVKTTFFTRVKTTYTFVNIDKPEERISMITFSEGIDPQDKGSGKAMTYADKYALMKAYKISTGDDPDQHGSEEQHYSRRQNGYGQQPYQHQGGQYGQQPRYQQQTPPPQPQPVPVPKCGRCGGEITPVMGRTGEVISAENLVKMSRTKFKGAYCADCQRAIQAEIESFRQAAEDAAPEPEATTV